jgi:8-oxo-dGTP pyrophosphatase MutT (NUDIX family)
MGQIARILDGLQRESRAHRDLIPAAVLVPLFERDGELYVLLECRTEHLDHHKGQVSFPGGVTDPGDADAVATALREAEEEVGLKAHDVQVLGVMSDEVTVTGFCVTPVVGRVPYPYDYEPNPAEVAEVLEVPWRLFVDKQGHRREEVVHQGKVHQVDFYPFEGHQIWGATARIVNQLLSLVDGQRAAKREAQ